jgi:protein-disulfide isomerase
MGFWTRWNNFPSEARRSKNPDYQEDAMSKLKIPVGPNDHVQGPEEAPVTLVEYGDYECPHCGRAYPIVKQLQKRFGKKLRFVFRNFPLKEIHPHAWEAAEVAECAGAQDRFWEMHDAIFENQQNLSNQTLVDLAHQLKLDVQAVAKSLKAGDFTDRIQADFSGGVRSGVNGTPTFFINGERHDADFALETLTAALSDAMGGHARGAAQ